MITPLIYRGICRVSYCIFHPPLILVREKFIKESSGSLTGLTCGEMSEAGWAERSGAWPGQASRGGTASSSGPGSGCVCTPDLWTRGNLCLCSERERERGGGALLEMLAGPSKHNANTARKLPNTELKVQTRPVHTGPDPAGR